MILFSSLSVRIPTPLALYASNQKQKGPHVPSIKHDDLPRRLDRRHDKHSFQLPIAGMLALVRFTLINYFIPSGNEIGVKVSSAEVEREPPGRTWAKMRLVKL